MTDLEPQLQHDLRCTSWRSTDPSTCSCRGSDGHRPPWIEGRLLAWDLETTDANPLEARIVTATTIDIRPGVDPVVTNWLSDVDGEDIPEGAAKIHGVTTEYARANGRPHREVVTEVAQALRSAWSDGAIVCGHNIGAYDLAVLDAECRRISVDFQPGPIADSLVLDRGADRYRKGKRTLTAAAAHYGVPLSEDDAHASDADALASARIAWKIVRRYPAIGSMTLAELQNWQRDTYISWAENFGEYLRKQGKTDDVARTWPLRADAKASV